MNTYVTGATIKMLREKWNLTQAELAERIGVSSMGCFGERREFTLLEGLSQK